MLCKADCDREATTHGLCNAHALQQARGQELKPLRKRRSADERFEVVSTRVRTSQLVDLKIEADRSGLSVYDLLAQIIERWRPKP